jgi:hypothetical protein
LENPAGTARRTAIKSAGILFPHRPLMTRH